jgi:hypothetical protein
MVTNIDELIEKFEACDSAYNSLRYRCEQLRENKHIITFNGDCYSKELCLKFIVTTETREKFELKVEELEETLK